MKRCRCGSNLYDRAQYDARGIFLDYTCNECHAQKMSKFRPEVLTDPNYDHDEPIEEE